MATSIVFAAVIAVASAFGARVSPSRWCARCGGRLCPRCDAGVAAATTLCEACTRLFYQPETTDRDAAPRADRGAARARAAARARRDVASLGVPGGGRRARAAARCWRCSARLLFAFGAGAVRLARGESSPIRWSAGARRSRRVPRRRRRRGARLRGAPGARAAPRGGGCSRVGGAARQPARLRHRRGLPADRPAAQDGRARDRASEERVQLLFDGGARGLGGARRAAPATRRSATCWCAAGCSRASGSPSSYASASRRARRCRGCAVAAGWIYAARDRRVEDLLTRETFFSGAALDGRLVPLRAHGVDTARRSRAPARRRADPDGRPAHARRVADLRRPRAHARRSSSARSGASTRSAIAARRASGRRERRASACSRWSTAGSPVRRIIDLSRLGTFDATRILADLPRPRRDRAGRRGEGAAAATRRLRVRRSADRCGLGRRPRCRVSLLLLVAFALAARALAVPVRGPPASRSAATRLATARAAYAVAPRCARRSRTIAWPPGALPAGARRARGVQLPERPR